MIEIICENLTDEFFSEHKLNKEEFIKGMNILIKIVSLNLNKLDINLLFHLAYSFGVFHGDDRGITLFRNLFLGIPKTIPYSKRGDLFNFLNFSDDLKSKFLELDIQDIDSFLKNIYKRGEDGDFHLQINPQSNKKITALIRYLIEKTTNGLVFNQNNLNVFNNKKFMLVYNRDFKDFFIENLVDILNLNLIDKIRIILNRFNDIQSFYPNKKITLDMALNFISTVSYTDVMPWVERLADLCFKFGINESDFLKLQDIYLSSKNRFVSSIPYSFKAQNDKYSYELLSLDDPFSLLIGYFSGNCQRVNAAGEGCMIHGSTDYNGKLFVIKDNLGKLVCSSWIWRNGNILCIDSIEFSNNRKIEDIDLKVIFQIYFNIAHAFINIDNIFYKEFYDNGLITEEEYNLRLSKVLLGVGQRDGLKDLIKNSFVGFDGEVKVFELRTEYKDIVYDSIYQKDSLEKVIFLSNDDRDFCDLECKYIYSEKLKIKEKDDLDDIDYELLKKYMGFEKDLLIDEYKYIINANFIIILKEEDDLIFIFDYEFINKDDGSLKMFNDNIYQLIHMHNISFEMLNLDKYKYLDDILNEKKIMIKRKNSC